MERRVLVYVLLVDQSEVLLLLLPLVKTFHHLQVSSLGGHVKRCLIQLIAREEILTGVKGDELVSQSLQSAQLRGQVKRSVPFVVLPSQQGCQQPAVGLQPVQHSPQDLVVFRQDREVHDVPLVNIHHLGQLIHLVIVDFSRKVSQDFQSFVANGSNQRRLLLMVSLLQVGASVN